MIGFLLFLKRINGRWHCLNEGSARYRSRWDCTSSGSSDWLGLVFPPYSHLPSSSPCLLRTNLFYSISLTPHSSLWNPSSPLIPYWWGFVFFHNILSNVYPGIVLYLFHPCTDVCLDDGPTIVYDFVAKWIDGMQWWYCQWKKKNYMDNHL